LQRALTDGLAGVDRGLLRASGAGEAGDAGDAEEDDREDAGHEDSRLASVAEIEARAGGRQRGDRRAGLARAGASMRAQAHAGAV
jgi:hypothetical protein